MEVKNSKEHGKGTSKIFEIGRLFLLICGVLLVILAFYNIFIPIVFSIKEIPTTGIIKEITIDRNIIIELEQFEYDGIEVADEVTYIDGTVHNKAYLCAMDKIGQTIDITLLEERTFNILTKINKANYYFDKYTYEMSTEPYMDNVRASICITLLGIVCFVFGYFLDK